MRLALGTAQFGMPYGINNQSGQVSSATAREMLAFAHAGGIDTLDTAVSYGESESRLGRIGVHNWKVITKLPTIPDDIRDIEGWTMLQIEQSLKHLNISKLHGVLLHRSDQLFGDMGPVLVSALTKLKNKNLVEKIGVSIYAPSELDSLTKVFTPDIVQAPFNLIDRRLLSSGWLQKLKDQGVDIYVRSVFLQGLLLTPRKNILPKFERWRRCWDEWDSWLSANAAQPVEACLGFVQQFPQIDKFIVGADTARQLSELIKASTLHKQLSYPDLSSEEEMLIHPGNWSSL